MPRSTGGLAFAFAVTLVIANGSAALGGGTQGYDHVDFNGGDRGQDHVNFAVETSGDEWGEDHVDFSVDGTDEQVADSKGQDHIDFRVDPAGAYMVGAELFPGENGAEICCAGGRGNGHVDFRITIRADGGVEVNGRQVARCDPAEACRVSLEWCPGTGALVVQVTDAKGLALAAQYAIEDTPEEVRIAAAEVRSLSVVPR